MRTSTVDLRFGPLGEDKHDQLQPPGGLRVARNCRVNDQGEYVLRSSATKVDMSTNAPDDAVNRIFAIAHDGEQRLVADETNIHVMQVERNASSNPVARRKVAQDASCSYTLGTNVFAGGTSKEDLDGPSVASNYDPYRVGNGDLHVCVAWRFTRTEGSTTTTGVRVKVMSAETWATLAEAEVDSTTSSVTGWEYVPRVVVNDATTFHVLYGDDSSNLQMVAVDVSAAAASVFASPSALQTDWSSLLAVTPVYNKTDYNRGGYAYAYETTTSGTVAYEVDGTSYSIASITGVVALAVYATSGIATTEYPMLMTSDNTDIKLHIFTGAPSTVTTHTLENTVSVVTNGVGFIHQTLDASSLSEAICVWNTFTHAAYVRTNGLSAPGTPVQLWGQYAMATAGDVHENNPATPTVHALPVKPAILSINSAYALTTLDRGNTALLTTVTEDSAEAARVDVACLAGQTADPTTVGANLPIASPAKVGPYEWAVPVRTYDRAGSEYATVRMLTFRALDYQRFHTAEVGGSLFFGGGAVMQWDGEQLFEMGWFYPPVIATATPSSSGGSIVAGDYQYKAVYEWKDTQGKRHQSQPSLVKLVTVGGTTNGSVALAVTHMRHSRRQSNTADRDAKVVFFRTEAGGSIFYRIEGLGDDDSETNNPLATSVSATFTDTNSDADWSLTSMEKLYADGGTGELDAESPPPSRVICAHGDRLAGISDEDPNLIWFSKIHVAGTGLAASSALQVRIDAARGGLTALASQDDALVAFAADQIWVTHGRGPTNTGGGTPFADPQRISADIGCVEFASVVTAPDGIFFRGRRGMYLLPRGGATPVFVGGAVIEALGPYPDVDETDGTLVRRPTTRGIVRAVHQAETSRVVWLLEKRSGWQYDGSEIGDFPDTDHAIVYDYRAQRWYTWAWGHDDLDSQTRSPVGLDNWGGELAVAMDEKYQHVTENISEVWLHFRDGDPADFGLDHASDGQPYEMTLETSDINFGAIDGYHSIRRLAVFGAEPGTVTLDVTYDGKEGSADESSGEWTVVSATGVRYSREFYPRDSRRTQSARVKITGTAGVLGCSAEVGQRRRGARHLSTERA